MSDGLTRRQLLISGAAATAGAAAATGIHWASSPDHEETAEPFGTETVSFFGTHQAALTVSPQAHASFLAWDFKDGVERADLVKLMKLLTADAARLCAGKPPLADTEPEMAGAPGRLTVMFGFGPGFVKRAKGESPAWLKPLPEFVIDRLREEWNDGDLLIQVASDDPLALAHAVRMLSKDTRYFATLRWRQDGFRNAAGALAQGQTQRNLFGQIDGTINPALGSAEFNDVVWSNEGWLAGGTSAVIRRIAMNLDTWDELDRPGREASIGRRLSDGSPLTGSDEFDEPDFEKTDEFGLPVIAEFAHIKVARGDNSEKILRVPYNYDGAGSGEQVNDSGLIFVAYQADPVKQFIPMQQRLAEGDMLNEWTTPIGSAVFAIPPGCSPDGFIGDTLLG